MQALTNFLLTHGSNANFYQTRKAASYIQAAFNLERLCYLESLELSKDGRFNISVTKLKGYNIKEGLECLEGKLLTLRIQNPRYCIPNLEGRILKSWLGMIKYIDIKPQAEIQRYMKLIDIHQIAETKEQTFVTTWDDLEADMETIKLIAELASKTGFDLIVKIEI